MLSLLPPGNPESKRLGSSLPVIQYPNIPPFLLLLKPLECFPSLAYFPTSWRGTIRRFLKTWGRKRSWQTFLHSCNASQTLCEGLGIQEWIRAQAPPIPGMSTVRKLLERKNTLHGRVGQTPSSGHIQHILRLMTSSCDYKYCLYSFSNIQSREIQDGFYLNWQFSQSKRKMPSIRVSHIFSGESHWDQNALVI